MVRGTVSKLIFVDSSVNTTGDTTRVLLPAQPFSATGNERLALTLVSFSIRRNWTNINDTNRTFYLFLNSAYHEVNIAAGVYSTFASLALAIKAALDVTIATIAQISTAAVAYDAVTRKYTISLTMAAGSEAVEVEIRTFFIKSGTLPTNVSVRGGFNDAHEILGARPVRVAANAASSMVHELAAGVNILTSVYPASLSTLDGVYIHLNTLETGNFCSTGHDSRAQDSLRLIESSLFAKVNFDDSTFTEAHEVIQYEDSGGDLYQTFLTRKSLDHLDFRITDARGRSLSFLDRNQAEEGLMAFRLVLRWDLFQPAPTPTPRSEIGFERPPTI